MFLLICVIGCGCVSISEISIHLMFLLIMALSSRRRQIRPYFNTSHVSINRSLPTWKQRTRSISIHLMFLLIQSILTKVGWNMHFNTSHVSINPRQPCYSPTFCLISIHLMFLLIALRYNLLQNIFYFNTSHVSINLRESSDRVCGNAFQYISCFY